MNIHDGTFTYNMFEPVTIGDHIGQIVGHIDMPHATHLLVQIFGWTGSPWQIDPHKVQSYNGTDHA